MPTRQNAAVVPPRSWHTCMLEAGAVARIELPDGPQVIDLIAFNAADHREHSSASQTRMVYGTHLSTGASLLSAAPWARPMLTMSSNSVNQDSHDGTRPHDLMFGPCHTGLREQLYGESSPGCRELLSRAIAAYDMRPEQVVDPLNLFMSTGVDDAGDLFFRPSTARAGDAVELVAELACIIAMSTCPGASSGPAGHHIVITVS